MEPQGTSVFQNPGWKNPCASQSTEWLPPLTEPCLNGGVQRHCFIQPSGRSSLGWWERPCLPSWGSHTSLCTSTGKELGSPILRESEDNETDPISLFTLAARNHTATSQAPGWRGYWRERWALHKPQTRPSQAGSKWAERNLLLRRWRSWSWVKLGLKPQMCSYDGQRDNGDEGREH